jgi:uncharacterized protein YegJ (DUF2314 family)
VQLACKELRIAQCLAEGLCMRHQKDAGAEEDRALVPVFLPALVVLLVHAEDVKGEPLSKNEVLAIRDDGSCIMMDEEDARAMDESRGYRDIDPENCWYDWQIQRREMGRKPDLDPGPRFKQLRATDPAYQRTIVDARSTLAQFRAMLHVDGTPRPDALIKTRLVEGDNSALMWLNNTAIEEQAHGDAFTAELFELPDSFSSYTLGERLKVKLDDLLDWMVNEDGHLRGGYSLRYTRAGLSEAEQQDFDAHIGVTVYR